MDQAKHVTVKWIKLKSVQFLCTALSEYLPRKVGNEIVEYFRNKKQLLLLPY